LGQQYSVLRENHPPIINLSLRLFLYQHVKDHVVIFSEAKERLSRMQVGVSK
jgi:hypothetical protein